MASRGGHGAVIRLLLERGGVEADSKYKYGQTPLWWAAERGREGIVRLLLERDSVGAEVNNAWGGDSRR